jgi:hypothetical protein
MKNMAFKVTGHVLILAHTSINPSDEEWISYVREVRRQGSMLLPQIVFTEGGHPNSVQRKVLVEALAGRSVRVAVLSDLVSVQGVVTAIGWFNRDIKSFAPANLAAAMHYLDIPYDHYVLIESTLSLLRSYLALGDHASRAKSAEGSRSIHR